MNSRSPRFETIAYLLAFLLAFGLRFARLGALALTDSEAALALQALHIAEGARPALASNVAYTNLTAILFYIFGASNLLARFWPALAGSALVFAPWLFRERISPRAALILAFFLAIDPALVALARTAGSSILAVMGAVFAAAFWQRGQARMAGVFAALALLGGPALWSGLLGLALTWLILQSLTVRTQTTEPDLSAETAAPEEAELPAESPAPQIPATVTPVANYRALLASAIFTLLALSSLLLFAPQGIGAWPASLPEYLRGWVSSGNVPITRLLIALTAYQPLALLLAFIATVRGWVNGDRIAISLSLWAVIALLLALFQPTRLPVDLVWTLLPLWALAAIEAAHHLHFVREERLEITGVIAFTVILLGFAWLDLSALYWTPLPSREGSLRLYLLLGSLILFVISIILVWFGWSGRIARIGAAWGLAIILGLYTLGAAWGATGLRTPNGVELYQAGATIAQADLLAQTVADISEWSTGQADDLPVTVFGVDSPALLWALRDHNPQVVAVLDPASTPDLVITPPQQSLQVAAAYRGQDFTWRQTAAWDVFTSYSLRWLTLREMPLQPENIVLWARDDLFIDAEP